MALSTTPMVSNDGKEDGEYNEQVHTDNDAFELDILGHFGTLWDNSEDFSKS